MIGFQNISAEKNLNPHEDAVISSVSVNTHKQSRGIDRIIGIFIDSGEIWIKLTSISMSFEFVSLFDTLDNL
jgi:hypothetical protein